MKNANQDIYKNRRKKLLKILREKHPRGDRGVVILFADFENHRRIFRQESSFYYLTGIDEPGVVFCLFFDGTEALFVPDYENKREQWVSPNKTEPLVPQRPPKPCAKAGSAAEGGVSRDDSTKIKKLGKPCKNYWLKPFFDESEYEFLIGDIKNYLGDDGLIFALLDQSNDNYFVSMYRFEKLFACLSFVRSSRVSPEAQGAKGDVSRDISEIISQMRRSKDDHELSLMQEAVDVTCKAFDHVAKKIRSGLYEYEIQAEIEKVFTCNRAQIAFPSIVASGKNSTILHYMARDQKLKDGDLLVIDIGAEVRNYCADLTRTFPVGGRFSPRQKEVYQIVLDLQEYVAGLAKPGLFLHNPDEPEKSLHHLARAFLARIGYDAYFAHGIGHFLGLDVHDVGDATEALGPGDVITIEPGIYIPEENIGIRIEDDFVVTPTGCWVLSEKLVKTVSDVESMM